MDMLEEIIYDFELRKSRVLISSEIAIIDNVKQLIVVSEDSIVVSNGKEFTAINGRALIIKELAGYRMKISGSIHGVEIYKNDNK